MENCMFSHELKSKAINRKICLFLYIFTPPFYLNLLGKKLNFVLPNSFSFFQVLMCFTLFKYYKISIINSTMATQTIVSVKTFLRNFLVTLSECSMFTFTIVEPIPKFCFYFPNVWNFTTNFAF